MLCSFFPGGAALLKRRTPSRRQGRRKRKNSSLRSLIAKFWPNTRSRRRILQVFRTAPLGLQALITVAAVVLLWFVLNWMYQVIRKPSELFFPVSATLNKVPAETWRQYAPLFRKYSTNVISPEFLAALAQVEGSGNPVVRTYWRWSLTPQPFKLYRPASSAVGMYQITDGTFAEARRFCIRDHAVVRDGPWNDWNTCWFNRLYTRVIPSHAVELTSAYLDRSVTNTLENHHVNSASLEHKLELAAVIHLCGAGAGDAYVRRGMRLADGQRCGDHEAREYVAHVTGMKRVFQSLEAEGAAPR